MNRPLSSMPGYAAAPQPSDQREDSFATLLDIVTGQADLLLPLVLLAGVVLTAWLTADSGLPRRARVWPRRH